jgi:DivIVA domain-containing protein
VSLLWVLVGIAVLGGVAVVAAGRGQGLSPAEPDRPDVVVPEDRPLAKPDVDQLRFSVGLRGYRMDEVDDVLDRLAGDLAERDDRIAQLEAQLGGAEAGAPAHPPRHAAVATGPVPPSTVETEPDGEVPSDGPEQELHDPTSARTMIVPVHELDDPEQPPPPGEPGGG